MIYAPIYIPTLNRYEHFRQCLESLESCTGAGHTDVIIGLDYPPSDKYVDGWKKIDRYLHEKEAHNGFANLIVHRRDHNCGIGNANSNSARLSKYIRENYDRYIFSEDDNVFSPNFLQFMNKGLEYFEKDERVVAICGYCHPIDYVCKGNYFAQNVNHSVWGVAKWVRKDDVIKADLERSFFKKALYSPYKMYKVAKTGWGRVLSVILNSTKDYVWASDQNLSIWMLLNDKVMLMPSITKVRNIGWDELSVNNKADNPYLAERARKELTREVDSGLDFDFVGNPYENFGQMNKAMIDFENIGRVVPFKLKIIIITKYILRIIQFWR